MLKRRVSSCLGYLCWRVPCPMSHRVPFLSQRLLRFQKAALNCGKGKAMGMPWLTVEVRGQEAMLVLYFCPCRVISAAIPTILLTLDCTKENQFYLFICSSIFSLLTHFKAFHCPKVSFSLFHILKS